ncbi:MULTISPECIES: transposase [Streptomyces]|uniref:transposase n=1 Tax=Streptomyces TaxID=1883 RepID=UPI0035BC4E3D
MRENEPHRTGPVLIVIGGLPVTGKSTVGEPSRGGSAAAIWGSTPSGSRSTPSPSKAGTPTPCGTPSPTGWVAASRTPWWRTSSGRASAYSPSASTQGKRPGTPGQRWPDAPKPRSTRSKTEDPGSCDLREVVNALLYQNRTGCQWRLPPHDLPASSSVFSYFTLWRQDGLDQRIQETLRCRVRERARQLEDPSLVIIDTRFVRVATGVAKKTTGLVPHQATFALVTTSRRRSSAACLFRQMM